jgi:iron(III) transport system ATP-binding protein
MADRLAVMLEGRIVQMGSPAELYSAPANRFVADFMGNTNLLDGVVRARDETGRIVVDTPEGQIRCTSADDIVIGSEVSIAVRPESITILPARPENPPDDATLLQGGVETVAFVGDFLDARIRVGGRLLRVKLNPSFTIAPGRVVWLSLPVAACLVLPK